jgi:hypothetical protein
LQAVKSTVVVIIALALSLSAFAQDSLSITNKIRQYDSLARLGQKQFITDSLTTLSWCDSLRHKIGFSFNKDSLGLKNKIDSLQQRGLSTSPYSQRLDSAIQKRNSMLAEINRKQGDLISKTKTRVEEWKSKVGEKLGVRDLPKTPDVNLPAIPGASDMSLPPMPDLNAQGLTGVELPEMPALNAADFNGADLTPDLGKVNESLSFGNMDGLKGIQEKIGDATGSLKDLSSATQNADKLVESGVEGLKEVSAVKELGDGLPDNEFTKNAELLKDPGAAQEQLKEQVVEKAVNHFEGKEQVLQEAMDKIAKYKQKYESINSLSDIKKRPPNPMKGKPFIERIVPGVALQFQQRGDLLLDVNPYAGYRISGRLTSGIGWNQRIGYDTDKNYFTSVAVVYGPRFFAEFKVWKGFTARGEVEWMNTVVPPRLGLPINDQSQREWVNSVFVGVKKEYRFIKSVKGTAFIMFNLFNREHKSPYGDVVNTRFGFEFPLKKKKKEARE